MYISDPMDLFSDELGSEDKLTCRRHNCPRKLTDLMNINIGHSECLCPDLVNFRSQSVAGCWGAGSSIRTV